MEQIKKTSKRNFDRCAYTGCQNGRLTTKHLLHHFPTDKEPKRLETWLVNCGNKKLREYSGKTLRRHAICGDHFDAESFHNNDRTRQLKKGTVPFRYHEVFPKKTLDKEINNQINSLKNPIINLVVTDTWKDRELTKLQNENKILRTELRDSRLTVKSLENQLQRTLHESKQRVTKNPATIRRKTRIAIEELLEKIDMHPTAKALVKLQLHTPNCPYKKEEKNFVKQLYCQAPESLKRLRSVGCNFPSENSIRTWLEECEMSNGICEEIIEENVEEEIVVFASDE